MGADFDPGELADEVDTVGGLVFDLAGHVPAAGDIVKGLKGFEFEVLQADGRQILKLKIQRLRQTAPRAKAKPKAKPVTAPAKPEETPAAEEAKAAE